MFILEEGDVEIAQISVKRQYVAEVLTSYWPHGIASILALPVPDARDIQDEPLPPQVKMIGLPEWAEDAGISKGLLVPEQFVMSGEGPEWTRVDWFSVIFWYINGTSERALEKKNGTIHSYAFLLKGWDCRIWERAWVNRVALFLRRWAARLKGLDEEKLFGPLPAAEIVMTHDVDAVTKTAAIRCKQAAFLSFNSLRGLLHKNARGSMKKFARALRFLFLPDNYWCFDGIRQLENKFHIQSYFFVYGGSGGLKRTPKELLMDPSYTVDGPALKRQLQQLHAEGCVIGLHPSFDSWHDAQAMKREKNHLENAVGSPVSACRQHWLRFSWQKTWKAQEEAGFALDSTLGFNDRASFRNGAALCYHPWDEEKKKPMKLKVLPMMLMDSQLYDYANIDENQIRESIRHWVNEIRAVHGTAAVLWHQQTMSRDFGWAKGFQMLLEMGEGSFAEAF